MFQCTFVQKCFGFGHAAIKKKNLQVTFFMLKYSIIIKCTFYVNFEYRYHICF